jgi:hypothetical protein
VESGRKVVLGMIRMVNDSGSGPERGWFRLRRGRMRWRRKYNVEYTVQGWGNVTKKQ